MAFVLTAGQVQAIAPAPSWGGAAIPQYVQLGPSTYSTYEALWRAQPAVRTVVSFLARNVAQLPLDVYRRLSGTDRRKDIDHPLAELLERPFPGTKWTKYRLLNWTIHELCIHDDAYWLKSRAPDGSPRLIPIPRRYIEPLGDNILMATGYRIAGTRGTKDVDAEQVVHFHGYHPDDTRRGCSPLETLRQILAEEWAAGQYREQMWRNGARVGGYISRPKDAPRWSPDAKVRFEQDWRALYSAEGSAAGGTPVLEDGMTYTPSGITPKDAQYIESRKLTRQEVSIAYHVPPMMQGIMDGATVGNVPEFRKMLYGDTLGPLLSQLSQDIEAQLLPDLEPGAGRRVYVEFNLSEKQRGSFEEQAAAISSSVGGPWMTRSEARALYNLPHVPEADELIVPLNVVEGGLSSPRDTAPDTPANEESNGKPPAPRPVAA
jgi:HK97 family phage portal protein